MRYVDFPAKTNLFIEKKDIFINTFFMEICFPWKKLSSSVFV